MKAAGLRRIALAAMTVASIWLIPGASQAECYGDPTNGTIPVTERKIYTIAVPGTNLVFYIDDRDYLDIDDDGSNGGLWVYMESNGIAGLQPGGKQYLLQNIPVPPIDPIPTGPIGIPETQVIPPNPVLPQGVTLFPGGMPIHPGVTILPGGFGGGSLADTLGSADGCSEGTVPDTLIF